MDVCGLALSHGLAMTHRLCVPSPLTRALASALLMATPQAALAAPPQAALTLGSSALGWGASSLLGASLLLLGLLLWIRARRAGSPLTLDAQEDDDGAAPQTTRLLPTPPPLPAAAVSAPLRARHDGSPDAGRSLTNAQQVPTESSLLKPLFTTRGEGQQKVCATCRRTYAGWMVICPVDATPLQPNPQHAAQAPRRAAGLLPPPSQSILMRMRCTSCQRRVAYGASFCPHDGKKLVMDTIEDASTARSFTVCRRCGADPERRAKPCHEQGCDVVTLTPSTLHGPTGLAMTLCPRCHTFGLPGQLRCPKDDELLVPVTAIELNALPHTGYGPKRKVCGACGTRYAGQVQHCVYDGELLKTLD